MRFFLLCLFLFTACFFRLNGQIAVELPKNNVLYIGLDNFLSVAAVGVHNEALQVKANTGFLEKVEGNRYNWSVSQLGDASLILIDTRNNDTLAEHRYQVKRTPDPTVLLGGKYASQSIPIEVFQVQTGLTIDFENMARAIQASVASFNLTRVSKRESPITYKNLGGAFSPKCKELILHARPGDIYYFDNICIKAPGDPASRDLGGLIFKIQ